MNVEIRQTDLVRVSITLRSRERAEPLVLNEAYTVESLGFRPQAQAAQVAAPEFDAGEYVRLLTVDPEAASRMMAEFHDAAADAVADGGVNPVEGLAEALVSHLTRTGVRGNRIVSDVSSVDGYVLSTADINISGPLVQGDTRVWSVTAVGTWG